jgi:hypothetical protein
LLIIFYQASQTYTLSFEEESPSQVKKKENRKTMLKFAALLLLALSSLTVVRAQRRRRRTQLAAPIGVCFDKAATLVEVESFCRDVNDCQEDTSKSGSNFECYMRCSTNADEQHYLLNTDCGQYGLVCHQPVTCLLPPVQGMDQALVSHLIDRVPTPKGEEDGK